MKKNNTDPKNPEKGAPGRARIPTSSGNKPQSWEKLGAVPAKTSKTLSSKARWPGTPRQSWVLQQRLGHCWRLLEICSRNSEPRSIPETQEPTSKPRSSPGRNSNSSQGSPGAAQKPRSNSCDNSQFQKPRTHVRSTTEIWVRSSPETPGDFQELVVS